MNKSGNVFYHGFRHSGTSDGESDIGTAMEKQLSDLNEKVNTLNFRINKTNEILGKNDRLAAERQKTSLENTTEAVNSLKETIEEKKFGKGETEEDIKE